MKIKVFFRCDNFILTFLLAISLQVLQGTENAANNSVKLFMQLMLSFPLDFLECPQIFVITFYKILNLNTAKPA
jgi:hypothetical protein